MHHANMEITGMNCKSTKQIGGISQKMIRKKKIEKHYTGQKRKKTLKFLQRGNNLSFN